MCITGRYVVRVDCIGRSWSGQTSVKQRDRDRERAMPSFLKVDSEEERELAIQPVSDFIHAHSLAIYRDR